MQRVYILTVLLVIIGLALCSLNETKEHKESMPVLEPIIRLFGEPNYYKTKLDIWTAEYGIVYAFRWDDGWHVFVAKTGKLGEWQIIKIYKKSKKLPFEEKKELYIDAFNKNKKRFRPECVQLAEEKERLNRAILSQ
jgi:hypothetical protein